MHTGDPCRKSQYFIPQMQNTVSHQQIAKANTHHPHAILSYPARPHRTSPKHVQYGPETGSSDRWCYYRSYRRQPPLGPAPRLAGGGSSAVGRRFRHPETKRHDIHSAEPTDGVEVMLPNTAAAPSPTRQPRRSQEAET